MTTRWLKCNVQDFIAKGEAELKTGPFGTQLHSSDYVDEGTPVINVRNIGFGEVRESDLEFIDDATVARLQSHLLEVNDIVFGRKGAVERHAFIQQKHARWFQGSDCLRLRLKSPSVDPHFISYSFLTESHKLWMINHCSHGSTMASLNQDIISRIPLTLPLLPTQRKIAAILNAYDDLIENNARRIAILEEMARNLYREWFVHFRFPGHKEVQMVDGVPEGWEIRRIREVATVYRGRSYKSSELVDEGGVPFLNLKCINRDGGFRRDGVKRYLGPYKETQTAREGDIIVGVTDMTQERRIVAHAARVPDMRSDFSVLSMDLVKLTPRAGVPNNYLYGMLRFSGFADQVKQHANGANVLHLNPDRIEEYEFTLPPHNLRKQFSEFCSNIRAYAL